MADPSAPGATGAGGGTDRVSTLFQGMLETDKLTRPPKSLDSMLDATERCIARYGLLRTSMSDVARELGVNRSTLYRHVDSLHQLYALVSARLAYQFIDEAADALLGDEPWPQLLQDLVVRTLRLLRAHPLVRRLLDHEHDVLGAFVADDVGHALVDRLAEIATPIFETAIASGQVRRTDPRLAAEFLARQVIVLMLFPPEHNLEQSVEFALGSLLPTPA